MIGCSGREVNDRGDMEHMRNINETIQSHVSSQNNLRLSMRSCADSPNSSRAPSSTSLAVCRSAPISVSMAADTITRSSLASSLLSSSSSTVLNISLKEKHPFDKQEMMLTFVVSVKSFVFDVVVSYLMRVQWIITLYKKQEAIRASRLFPSGSQFLDT